MFPFSVNESQPVCVYATLNEIPPVYARPVNGNDNTLKKIYHNTYIYKNSSSLRWDVIKLRCQRFLRLVLLPTHTPDFVYSRSQNRTVTHRSVLVYASSSLKIRAAM